MITIIAWLFSLKRKQIMMSSLSTRIWENLRISCGDSRAYMSSMLPVIIMGNKICKQIFYHSSPFLFFIVCFNEVFRLHGIMWQQWRTKKICMHFEGTEKNKKIIWQVPMNNQASSLKYKIDNFRNINSWVFRKLCRQAKHVPL